MKCIFSLVPRRWCQQFLTVTSICILGCSHLLSQEPYRDGDWMVRDPGELSMELQLSPSPEPKPALQHRFIPSVHDQVPGNAAVFYLRAMGFIEQSGAREELNKIYKKAKAAADAQGKGHDQVGPNAWIDMSPSELPIAEVKEYLRLLSFQPRDLVEARKRSHFSMERNIKEIADPVGLLIPEIQTMRELARQQRIRCRVAIAEGDLQSAENILGQQFAMARHLGDDGFLVTSLVGTAINAIAIEDLLHYVQQPKSKNMYWALRSLPNPVVSYENSMAFEYNFLFEQIKPLREVDEKPRDAGYWSDFIDRVLPSMKALQLREMDPTRFQSDPFADRASLTTYVASSYLNAKRYLTEEWKMDSSLLDQMPTTQVVFLAMRRFYEIQRDEQFKWFFLPAENTISVDPEPSMREQSEKWGWFAVPAETMLPAIVHVVRAKTRMQQQIALLQTIESIREYCSTSGGKLPETLNDLRLPAPKDPANGLPFDYKRAGNKAELKGSRNSNVRYQFQISVRP